MDDQAPSFIPIAAPVIGDREIAYVEDAVRSGWVSSIGPYIDRFEAGFARWVGVRHAVAVSNGTVALHLALHALGLGPGDEVIIPDLTFAATAHAVLQTGATPVLADVEADTFCIDPVAVERALGPRIEAAAQVGDHAALFGVAVALGVSAVASGSADDVLCLGASRDGVTLARLAPP